MIVTLLGPVVMLHENQEILGEPVDLTTIDSGSVDAEHRRLGFLPSYVEDVGSFRETSMSFATLTMLFVIMSCLMMIFISCFYHNQKTSPSFTSPRRHRLPKLVPPPLPVDGFMSWAKICLFLSDEEIINRIGYDSLIFLRFHRLALRCIVKMSVFSFVVLLPLNFTGGGHANASDLKGYVGSLLFTDFLRFTMANVSGGSPRLWVHCFAAYLLTGIVIRELLIEYEAFNGIRHRYLLSREPHLRTVLVTNIPRHLRSPHKITTYFRHVYPEAVKSVFMCQNLIKLERILLQRTSLLTKMEQELLLLCRAEKRKLYTFSRWNRFRALIANCDCCERLGCAEPKQEKLTRYYTQLEELNQDVEREQKRRRRVIKMMDRMESSEGHSDIDYILASPFLSDDASVKSQQNKVMGLTHPSTMTAGQDVGEYRPPSIGAPRSPNGSLKPHQPPSVAADSTGKAEEGRSHVHFSSDAPEQPQRHQQKGGLRDRSKSPVVTGVEGKTEPAAIRFEGKSDSYAKMKNQKHVPGKAKRAIRRYSKLARDVTFFGRRVSTTSPAYHPEAHIEDHVNEVTDKAFVEMRTFTASTIAIQSMHSSKPGSMAVTHAPEPRDVLWNNIYVSKGAARTRSYLGEALVLLLIAFYAVPYALVSLLVSESALISSSPRLAQLDQASALFSTAIAVVQPLCIVTLQQLLPPLFMAIGKAEGRVSFSEVQMTCFSRYFLFQVLNVFLVTTIAGSIFDTIAIILENPESAFEMLGNSLPRMSSFFITFVTLKTFLGLGVELARIFSLVQASLRYVLFPNPTLRKQRSVRLGMRSIDDPGWFPFHKILAQDMLVVVISVVFAVVAPLVLLPCALFCLFSRILWTHHHLYVFESVFETGGQFWPKIFRRFVFGLIIAQMTITGQFILKEARHEAYATIALILMTYVFLRSTRARYDPSSSTLPLEVATVMDISLSQEEEAMRRAQQRQQQEHAGVSAGHMDVSDRKTQSTESIPESSDTDDGLDPHLGTRIGRHDPFKRMYVQPALRANPRARPEQPFPPSQLGREESSAFMVNASLSGGSLNVHGSGLSEEEICDSGATVRLKGMNQQDRRLVNRWWNDQLQSCGDQRVLSILMGEECGTLTIGRRASLVELNENRYV